MGMSELTANDLRALRGEAIVAAFALEDGCRDDAFSYSVQALSCILKQAEDIGLNPDQLVLKAAQKYANESSAAPKAACLHPDGDAFDKPFVPSPEALALLRQSLSELG